MASFSVAESGAPLPQLLLRLLTFPILPPIGHHSYQCLRGRSPPTSYILCSASHWLATSKTRYVFFPAQCLLYLLPRTPSLGRLRSLSVSSGARWSYTQVRPHLLDFILYMLWLFNGWFRRVAPITLLHEYDLFRHIF